VKRLDLPPGFALCAVVFVAQVLLAKALIISSRISLLENMNSSVNALLTPKVSLLLILVRRMLLGVATKVDHIMFLYLFKAI